MNAAEGQGDAPPVPAGVRRGAAPAPVWLAVVATLLGLALAWWVKGPCTSHPWADNFQYRRLCYNDLQPLAGGRGILQGDLPYRDHELEYPVLTGTFMYGAGVLLRRIAGMGAAARHSPWLVVGAVLAAGAGTIWATLRSREPDRTAQKAPPAPPGPPGLAGPERSGTGFLTVASVLAFTIAGVLLAVWAGGIRNNSDPDYFRLSAILLVPFALAVTLTLRPHVTRERLMLWAVGTPLILYAFHNWDLLAVAGAAWGMGELERARYATAGAGLSLGASAKLYPGFLFPGALLERLAAKDLAGARRLTLWFAGVGVAVNLPWFLLSPSRWIGIWTFHADRYPDFGTVWYWLAHHGRRLLLSPGWDPFPAPAVSWYQSLVSYLSLLLFAAGTLWLLWQGWRRAEREGRYPTAAVGLGIVATFLLVSKVHSPQYALWLVPLVAMLDVPWRYVFAYLLGDLGVFVAGFTYFTVMSTPAPGWMGILEIAVLVRAAALGFLVWYAPRANRLQPAEAPRAVARQPAVLDPAAVPGV